VPLAGSQGGFELRPVIALPALDLDKFTEQLPRAAIQIIGDRFGWASKP